MFKYPIYKTIHIAIPKIDTSSTLDKSSNKDTSRRLNLFPLY